MKTMIKTQVMDSDRVLFLFYDFNNVLYGVNYFQGLDSFSDSELNSAYINPDPSLSAWIMDAIKCECDHCFTMPSPEYHDEIKFIDDAIWRYIHLQKKMELKRVISGLIETSNWMESIIGGNNIEEHHRYMITSVDKAVDLLVSYSRETQL